jgi:hypothetical protein
MLQSHELTRTTVLIISIVLIVAGGFIHIQYLAESNQEELLQQLVQAV